MGRVVLRGQIALVTGAAKRIGRAIACVLAEQGAKIILHFNRSAEEAESLAAELRRDGGQVWTIQAALDDPPAVEDLWRRSRELVSGATISILVNNASVFPSDSLESIDFDQLERILSINTAAPLQLSRLFAAQNSSGCIVNLLDSRMGGYMKAHLSYSLSKRLLFSLTRMMALEFAPRLRVNAVAPGMVLAPEGQDREELQRLVERAPLGRWVEEEDVARAVLFLLENDYLTGQVIYADGGAFLREDLYG